MNIGFIGLGAVVETAYLPALARLSFPISSLWGYDLNPQRTLPGVNACAALAALPVTWSAVHRSRRFSLLLTIALLAAAAGCVLSLSVGDRFNVSSSIQRDQLLFAIGLPAAVAAFVWGRERLGIEGAVIAFGTGVILSSLHLLRSSPNPWKTGLGAAVSVVVLALAHRFGRGGQLLAAAVLGGIFLFRDSRGSTGMLMLIVALLTWQIISDRLRTKTLTPASLRLRQILLLTGLTAAAVLAVVAASLAGYLGEDVQERTAAQSRGSTNLLFAARPELGASWALLTHRPWGYGAGVLPATRTSAPPCREWPPCTTTPTTATSTSTCSATASSCTPAWWTPGSPCRCPAPPSSRSSPGWGCSPCGTTWGPHGSRRGCCSPCSWCS